MEKDPLTSVFTSMRHRLIAAARRILSDDDDVTDALQDAFYRLWQRRDEIRSTDTAAGISIVTVRNIAIDTARRQQRHQSVPLDETDRDWPPPDDSTDDTTDDRIRQINAIIDSRLSPLHRTILYQREQYGWEIADIAQTHDLSEANVRMILSRARNTVRACYQQYHTRQ